MPAPAARPQRRAEIPTHLQHIARQLFAAQGYAAVTMEQIAARAGVSKRTLYKHFPVKEALLAQLLEAELAHDLAQRDLRIDVQAGFRRSMAGLLQASADWCDSHRDVLLPYIRHKFASFDPGATDDDNGLVSVWAALIVTAQARGELRAHRSPGQLAIYFHYLYLGALMRWLTTDALDLRQEFNAVLALFVEGAA